MWWLFCVSSLRVHDLILFLNAGQDRITDKIIHCDRMYGDAREAAACVCKDIETRVFVALPVLWCWMGLALGVE